MSGWGLVVARIGALTTKSSGQDCPHLQWEAHAVDQYSCELLARVAYCMACLVHRCPGSASDPLWGSYRHCLVHRCPGSASDPLWGSYRHCLVHRCPGSASDPLWGSYRHCLVHRCPGSATDPLWGSYRHLLCV